MPSTAPITPRQIVERTASFRSRALATAIDTLVMSVFSILLGLGVGMTLGWLEVPIEGAGPATTAVAIGLGVLYVVLLHAGPWQGTLGKRMVGIRVVSLDGTDLGVRRSGTRYLATMLSGILFGAGYLVSAARPDRAALHDLICKTRVVKTKEDPSKAVAKPRTTIVASRIGTARGHRLGSPVDRGL